MIRKLAFAALLLAAAGGGAAALAAEEPVALAPAAAASPADHRILVMLQLPAEHYRPAGDYGSGGGYGDAAAAEARKRLAGRLARENGLNLIDNWPMPMLGIDCVIMEIPDGRSAETVAEHMSHLASVSWSQPMHSFDTQGSIAHNDRLFEAQPAAHEWQLADLHRMATGKGVKVAVIDSMVDAAHPDLRGALIDNRDFVGGGRAPAAEAHGTGIAGIIGARADNAVGIAGVAPGAELMGLRACWQKAGAATVCDTISLARALTYAVEHKAQVINLSLTGPRDLLLTKLVDIAMQRGAAVVAAVDPKTDAGFPASIPGVIAVAQLGLASGKANVYNAPGRDVPTTEPGGRWYLVSGNSYAAAHVSGLIALLRQLESKPAPQRLLVTSRAGGGTIDACRTLARAAGQAERRCQSAN